MRPHLPYGKVLIRSFVVALTGASREGSYARAYSSLVGRHNLVCSFLFLWYLVPVWDRFATTVAVGVFGRHGATRDLALRGSWSELPGRVHDKGRVSSECFGPPEWECEARCSVVWVKCATSAECIHSIDSRFLGYGHNSSVSHTMDQLL